MNEDCLDRGLHKTAQTVRCTTPGGTIHMDNNVNGAPRVAHMRTVGLEHLHFEPLTVVLATGLPPPSQLALTAILLCAGSG